MDFRWLKMVSWIVTTMSTASTFGTTSNGFSKTKIV